MHSSTLEDIMVNMKYSKDDLGNRLCSPVSLSPLHVGCGQLAWRAVYKRVKEAEFLGWKGAQRNLQPTHGQPHGGEVRTSLTDIIT